MNPNQVSQVAKLLSDPSRNIMLNALMQGKALTATELATHADITAQTASSHLAKFVKHQLIVMHKQGRHRYFQLAGRHVAEMLESMANFSSQISDINTGPTDPGMRNARVCYDHLAGTLAVQLLDALQHNALIENNDSGINLSNKGMHFFTQRGANLEELVKKRRPLCRNCLDWSERRFHLAGALGKWIFDDLIQRRWAQPHLDSRALRFSNSGLNAFFQTYHLGD